MEPSCNFTTPRSDFCEAIGDIRINGANSTIYFASQQKTNLSATNNTTSWHIRPYARKTDKTAMGLTKNWFITDHHDPQTLPSCNVNHQVPAIIFSTGGYAGNHFHSFTDIVIPLFLTSRKYKGQVKFLITDYGKWWVDKFQVILKKLSDFEVIDIDHDDKIHCFPSIRIGLESHKELNMNPSLPPYYSLDHFRIFLRHSFSLNRTTAIRLQEEDDQLGKKPRLLLISRKRSRSITNEGKVVKMARKLGFEVVVSEMNTKTSLSEFAELVNSCDAVMGVHGAGLSNIVFLPDNAVFIQIVPLGHLEWLSIHDFGDPAKDMKLKYLQYSIKESESSLTQQYPRDDVVFKDPNSFQAKGWFAFRAVYMDKQDVKLDVKRFKPTLVKALELLHDHHQAKENVL